MCVLRLCTECMVCVWFLFRFFPISSVSGRPPETPSNGAERMCRVYGDGGECIIDAFLDKHIRIYRHSLSTPELSCSQFPFSCSWHVSWLLSMFSGFHPVPATLCIHAAATFNVLLSPGHRTKAFSGANLFGNSSEPSSEMVCNVCE